MKKMTKIFSAVLVMMMLLSIVTCVFAADDYDPIKMKEKSSNVNVDKIESVGAGAIKVVTTIGMVASVIVLVVLGIKYMMGSAEEKAEYKKTLLPYLLGAVLIFAASAIASMVYSFAVGL